MVAEDQLESEGTGVHEDVHTELTPIILQQIVDFKCILKQVHVETRETLQAKTKGSVIKPK